MGNVIAMKNKHKKMFKKILNILICIILFIMPFGGLVIGLIFLFKFSGKNRKRNEQAAREIS